MVAETAPSGGLALEIEGLPLSFGGLRRPLAGVSFAARDGSIAALWHPSSLSPPPQQRWLGP